MNKLLNEIKKYRNEAIDKSDKKHAKDFIKYLDNNKKPSKTLITLILFLIITLFITQFILIATRKPEQRVYIYETEKVAQTEQIEPKELTCIGVPEDNKFVCYKNNEQGVES